MAVEGTDKQAEVELGCLWAQWRVPDRGPKLAPDVVAKRDALPKGIHDGVTDCKTILCSAKSFQLLHCFHPFHGFHHSQFSTFDHVRYHQYESMAAQGNKDPCLIKNTPHLRSDIL